jgi:hypothetical protein
VTHPALSERIERSGPGRVAVSVAIVVVLAAQVVTHLPSDAAAHRSLGAEADLVLRLVASEQQWGVFAPDPRSTSLRLEGRITFEDGSSAVWRPPQGARIGANLRFYRWRKWLERVRADDQRALWEPTARWLAEEHAGGPSPVARVDLVRIFHENAVSGDQPPFEEFTFHTYVVEAAGER